MVERRTAFPTRSFLRLDHIPNLSQEKLKEAENNGNLILAFGVIPEDLILSEGEIIPAFLSIVGGNDFAVPNGWVKMMNKKNVLLLRLFATMFRGKPGEQAQKAITILDEDLKHFNVDKDFLRSSDPSKIGEFLFKLTFGVLAHDFIGSGSLLDMYVKNKNTENYKETIEFQMTVLKKVLTGLIIDDFGAYIRFEDMFQSYGLSSLFQDKVFSDLSEDQIKFVGDKLGVVKGAAFVKIFAEYKEKEDEFRASLVDEDTRTWDRLIKDWTEKQVSAVVSLLPQLKSPLVILGAMIALEFNLSQNNLNKEKWSGKDPEGLLFLLKWKWEEPWVTGLKEEYPDVFSGLEETIDFAGFSVPNKHLPRSAIAIIGNLSGNAPRDEFADQLRDIHDLVLKDRKAAVPWFLTLVILKNKNTLLVDLFDEMVGSLDSLPEAVRDTFLNRIPGKIWLKQDGKLFVAKTSKNYSSISAFPVYTSSMEESVVKAPEQIHKSEVVDQKKSIKIAEVELVPFFGEIGKVDSRETRQVVLDLFEEDRLFLNEEVLSIEFGNLEKEWRMKGKDRELLYINELNMGDKFAGEAKLASIEAVYINGNTVMIILNKNGILEDSRSVRLGIKGRIDESGLLQIEGMDHTFLGEKEHLFLNNLALHFATQPLFGVSGIPDSTDKDVIIKMNGVAASWKDNPLRRINNLPRIERNGGKPYVAVRVSDCKEPVLMCERSVH